MFTPKLALLLVFLTHSLAVRADDHLAQVVQTLETGQRPVRIVAFGDSITGVYYHTGGRRAWADMLKIALEKLYPKAKIEMFNAGISGQTSTQGLQRIERDVLGRKPDLVVVMFGMNDAARGSLDDFRKNMAQIATRCRAAGAAVVFSTTNSVYPNEDRPMERLARFAQVARDVAGELDVPVADSFEVYEKIRREDLPGWRLLMSETIHPNMNGHKLFAQVMAETISGRSVSLADVGPPDDLLRFTNERLEKGLPVRIVAMEPYDRIVPEMLRKRFPEAKLDVVPWPVRGQTLAQIEAWAKGIRDLKPNLVVIAVPAEVGLEESEEEFVRQYNWLLDLCISYGRAGWDLLAILPKVTGPVPEAARHRHQTLARQIIEGVDYPAIGRRAGDVRGEVELLGKGEVGESTGRPERFPHQMAAGDGSRRPMAVRRACMPPGSRTAS